MYAIFTLDGLDQVIETANIMRKEINDLAGLGFDVWFCELVEGFDVESWADENPGKRPKKPNAFGWGKVSGR